MARNSFPPVSGLRMVAYTVCPARASETAVAWPIPVLDPVTTAIAISAPWGIWDARPNQFTSARFAGAALGLRRSGGSIQDDATKLIHGRPFLSLHQKWVTLSLFSDGCQLAVAGDYYCFIRQRKHGVVQ